MPILSGTRVPVAIEKTTNATDLDWCAALMASNEPWITLKRGYEDSARLLKDPISETYLLRSGDDRIGFIMIRMKGSFTGYIQNIALVAGMRGQGIGEAAIGYIEELIFQSVPNVFICASSFNEGAQRLYSRLGYEVVGILTDYIIKGYDEVLMRKTKGPINDFKRQKPANA